MSTGNGTPPIFQSTILFSRFFGLIFTNSNSWKRLLHRGTMLVLQILVFVHELCNIRFWIEASKGLHRTLVIFEVGFRWMVFFGNYLMSTYHGDRVKAIIDDLLNYDVPLSRRTCRRIFRVHTAQILLNVSLLIIYNILGHDFVWFNSNHTPYTSLIYIFNDSLIMASLIQFSHIANTIRELFRVINKTLEKYRLTVPTNTAVLRLRHHHLHLCQLSSKVNHCFSNQLLWTILFCLVEITYALRTFIGEIMRPATTEGILKDVLSAIWGSVYLFFAYQLILIGSITLCESKNSSLIVHQLMNDYFRSRTLERELELFSVQIQQHQALFTIKLFDLNFKLITTLTGVLGTYLIILMTFQGEWKQGVPFEWNFREKNP